MPNKFVSHDHNALVLEEAIKLFSDKQSVYKIARTVSPDEVTECARKISYITTGTEYTSPITNVEHMASIAAKEKWISLLKQTKGIRVLDSWVVAADCKYNIRTKIDCVIEVNGMDNLQTVVYVKSIPSTSFESVIDRGAKRNDVVRVMTDMWLVEVTHGMIIYENRDTLDFVIYSVTPENAVINTIKAKTKDIYQHKIKGTTPPRPYITKTAKECKKCSFCESCWNKSSLYGEEKTKTKGV